MSLPAAAILLSAGVALLSVAACSAPDRPPLLPPDPPEGVLSGLGLHVTSKLSAAPGVAYFSLRNDEEPWSVHLLRVNLSACTAGFHVLEAPLHDGAAHGRARVSELFRAGGRSLLAAVNGDFFSPGGEPQGTEVVEGVVRRVAERPAFAWRNGGLPWVGMSSLLGDTALWVGWTVPRPRDSRRTEAVGGFPLLLLGGERVGDLEAAERPSFAAARHPRTGVGWDPTSGLLWLAVVDGRRPGHSAGMTLSEVATLFELLGAEAALNLDGGGSSTLVLRGVVMNRPSDPEGEREVANALAVRRDPTACRPGGVP